MIKVLVVEDSAVVRLALTRILSATPGIRVVGAVETGNQAIAAVFQFKPDVITMDIHMPGMDGFEATEKIMQASPTPIVIVTSAAHSNTAAMSFRAMTAGALGIVRTPVAEGHPAHRYMVAELVRAVKEASYAKPTRRKASRTPQRVAGDPTPADSTIKGGTRSVEVVAVGASTGGPPVIQSILGALPQPWPVPILIVQHMASGFLDSFVEWLGQTSGLPAGLAKPDERILPGRVYLAPDGCHMTVVPGKRILLTRGTAENGAVPSVSHLFQSVAEVYGPNAVGVLLTGMGKDGAKELKSMKQKGALTIAQDKETSTVHGMPGEAIKIGAATHILAADKIAPVLALLVQRPTKAAL